MKVFSLWQFIFDAICYGRQFAFRQFMNRPYNAFSCESSIIRAEAHSFSLMSHDLKVVVNIYPFDILPKGQVINSNS